MNTITDRRDLPLFIHRHPKKLHEVWSKTDGHCWYCGKPVVRGGTPGANIKDVFVADHMTPKCQGGSSDIDNLIPACWSCNSKKNGMNIEQFRMHLALKAAGIPYFTPEQISYLHDHGFDFPELERPQFWGESAAHP